MKEKKDIRTLQLLYAGLLSDLVLIISENGLLEKVSAQKQIENNLAAPARVWEFKFKKPADVFNFYTNVIGFAEWNSTADADSYSFKTKSCKLKSIAGYLLIASPCDLCCISPIRSLCGALEVPYRIEVCQTLWERESCIFLLSNKVINSQKKTNKSKKEK
jgi:hypothetical protein